MCRPPRVGLYWRARRTIPMISTTAEVREQHRFDPAALERYMREHVAGFAGPLGVKQFRGGQSNPTYYLTAGGREYVLRRKPPGKLLPSAHAVDREYRVITALGGIGFPVPRTYALCEDAGVIGTVFYIMDCVHGRVITDPAIPGLTPRERAAVYDSLGEVQARLHTVDWQGLADKNLAELGIPTEEDYVAAYCRRTRRAGIPDWDFCLAFAMFRLAAIAQGIMGRALAGTANDPNARERGARARPLAESAWALVGK